MNKCSKYDYIEFNKGLLDNCIDALYVILLEGSDRKKNVYSQINKFKLCKKNYIQINKSYKKCYIKELKKQNSSYHLLHNNIEIYKHAEINKFNNILILEDDFIFTNEIKNINIIKNIENFIKNTDFNLLYLGNFFLFVPNLFNIKFPYILLNGTAHSIIYSKKSRKIILEKYRKILDIKYLEFECHDIWYNSFLNNRYFYYKPLCFQSFPMTENRKNWSNNFINFILHFLKIDSEPINGMNNYYIIIYTIYICIFIILFYILFLLYKKYLVTI
jgi:hypothetical protein